MPSGPLQQLYNFLPSEGGVMAGETESILTQLRGMQEQVWPCRRVLPPSSHRPRQGTLPMRCLAARQPTSRRTLPTRNA